MVCDRPKPSTLSLSLSLAPTFPALHSLLPLFILCVSLTGIHRPASVSVKVSTIKLLSTLSAPASVSRDFWSVSSHTLEQLKATSSLCLRKTGLGTLQWEQGPFLASESQIKLPRGFLSDSCIYWKVPEKSHYQSVCPSVCPNMCSANHWDSPTIITLPPMLWCFLFANILQNPDKARSLYFLFLL